MATDNGGPDLVQLVLLGGLGALFAGSGVVFGTGVVAGVVFGEGMPGLAFSDASSVLTALPGHLDDPRAAYPPSAREVLPGPGQFYAALALLLVAGVLLAVGGLRVRRLTAGRSQGSDAVAVPGRRRPAAPTRARVGPESKAFATKKDTDDLAVKGPEPGQVILGWSYGRLIATEREHSVLVLGATRSGKTTGYAIPALREWDGPAVVLSAKTDLLQATLVDRRERGEVLLYDPTKVSGLPGNGWSPLARATNWRGAIRAANAMSKLSGTTAGLGGASHHWERVAAQLLAPLLLAAAHGGLDMAGHEPAPGKQP